MAKKGAAVIFTNSDGLVLIGNESQYVLDIISQYRPEIQDVVSDLSKDVKILPNMTDKAIKKNLDKKAVLVQTELDKEYSLGYIRYTFSKKTREDGQLYITDIKYRFLQTDDLRARFERVTANTLGLIKGGQGDDEDIDKTIEREIEEEIGMRGPYDLVLFPFKGILRKATSEYTVYGLKLTNDQIVQIKDNLKAHRSGEIYNIRFENLQIILDMKGLNGMSRDILTEYKKWLLKDNNVSTLRHLRVEGPGKKVKKVKRVIDPDMPPLMLPRGNTHYHGLYTISHPEPFELRSRAVILDMLNDYETSNESIKPFTPREKEVVLDMIVELFDNLITQDDQDEFSKNFDLIVRGFRTLRFGFNSSAKRRSGKRRSAKRRSGKRRSGKRRSGKRRSGKRHSGKRRSGKRLSV